MSITLEPVTEERLRFIWDTRLGYVYCDECSEFCESDSTEEVLTRPESTSRLEADAISDGCNKSRSEWRVGVVEGEAIIEHVASRIF